MSQFDRHLKTARNKQRRLYLGAAFAVLVFSLVIVAVLLITRATRIELLPADIKEQAQVSVSDGLAFITGKSLYALSGKPSVLVEAPGFYSRQQQLADADFGKVMTITLKPLPATIQLRAPVNDGRTKWLIDEQAYILADELIRELEPGDYTISVIHPYYEIKEISLSLDRGELVEQTIELAPVQGELAITSKPDSANITINGETQTSTPATLTLTGGEYPLQISLDGYEPIAETIEITREAPLVTRDYLLEPEKGQVSFRLAPAAGKLVLNKLQVDSGQPVRLAVNKLHTASYSKPGYFSQTKTFRVSTDNATVVNFDLEQETGQVELTATPEAQVSVNGEIQGTTPLTLTLAAVPQEIVFSKTGYREVVKQVTPSAAAVKKLEARLVPERLASLQEAPQSYRHAAGGTMKLFKPNVTFKMGAERSEPGQRANEFVKTVRLTRPFYAGVNEVSYAVYNRYDPNKAGQPNYPVIDISWLEAIRFCNWLSKQEGLTPVYALRGEQLIGINDNADGYRLLTEAEWEWLARRANRKQQTRFVWGDAMVIPKNAVNVADESARGAVRNIVPKYNDGYAGVAPTGSLNQELSGLFDQGGNVSEWVHDAYSLMPPKPGQVFTDPFDRSRNDSRTIKGASWRGGSLTELRASWREGLSNARDDVGFRIGRYVYGGN